mgnify:CR=1 FL=1
MKIEGHYAFDVPRETLWKALLEPEIISRTLPGCEEFVKVRENCYNTGLNVKVGPVQGRFKGQFSILDLNPPETYRLKLNGKGSTGFLQGEGHIRLEAQGEKTTLHYEILVQVGGRMAAVGQRLLETSARSIARQGLERLNEEVKGLRNTEGEKVVPSRDNASAASSGVNFVMNVAKDILFDLLPRERLLIPGALAIGGLFIILIIFSRTCGA